MLKDYVSELDDALCVKAVELFSKTDMMLSMESIVELFEQIVPEGEKKEKGIVYTPREIKEYIISRVCQTKNAPTVIDPSCGCGAFLVTAAQYIHQKFNNHHNEYSSVLASYVPPQKRFYG